MYARSAGVNLEFRNELLTECSKPWNLGTYEQRANSLLKLCRIFVKFMTLSIFTQKGKGSCLGN